MKEKTAWSSPSVRLAQDDRGAVADTTGAGRTAAVGAGAATTGGTCRLFTVTCVGFRV